MNGTGSTITFDGISYSIDSVKLATATNDFISHLNNVAGGESKVIIGGVEYSIDSTKIQDAVSELEAAFGNLENPDGVDIVIVLDEAILDDHVLE